MSVKAIRDVIKTMRADEHDDSAILAVVETLANSSSKAVAKTEGLTPRQELERVLSTQMATHVIAHRTKIKKPLTAFAAQLLARDLEKAGDPNDAAIVMIKSGWQGFNVKWYENAKGRQNTQHGSGGGNVLDMFTIAEGGGNG